jgi:hypothetical protein
MAYASLLGKLSAPSGASPMGMPPATQGTGPVPSMGQDGPPAATGVGAMPTGSGAQNVKGGADAAILALRDLAPMIPALGPQIDTWVDAIKAKVGAPSPTAGIAPAPNAQMKPGAPVDPTQILESGGPGAA